MAHYQSLTLPALSYPHTGRSRFRLCYTSVAQSA